MEDTVLLEEEVREARCGRQGSFCREGSGSGTQHAAAPRPALPGAKELPPLQPFET